MRVVPLLLLLLPFIYGDCVPLEQRFQIAQSSLELTKVILDSSDACGGFVPVVFAQSFEAIGLLNEYKTSMIEENWRNYKIEELEKQLGNYFRMSDHIEAIMNNLYKCHEAHFAARNNIKKWVSERKAELIKEVLEIPYPYHKCRLFTKPQIKESIMFARDEQCGKLQPFVLENYFTGNQIGPLHLRGMSYEYLINIKAENGFLVHGSQHLRTNWSAPTIFDDGIILKARPDNTAWEMFYRLNDTEYKLHTTIHQHGEDFLPVLALGADADGGTLTVRLQFDGCIYGLRAGYAMFDESDCAPAIGTVEDKDTKYIATVAVKDAACSSSTWVLEAADVCKC